MQIAKHLNCNRLEMFEDNVDFDTQSKCYSYGTGEI